VKVRLLYRGGDLDLERPLPGNAAELTRDLELEHLLGAMAGGDGFLHEVARRTLLGGLGNDAETIAYRQAVLRDFLARPGLLRSLYAIAGQAAEVRRKHYWHFHRSHPGGVLYGSLGLLEALVEVLWRLRRLADRDARGCVSEGLAAFFERLARDLPDEYLGTVGEHLKRLRLRRGVLLGAALGRGNRGTGYVLCEPGSGRPGWARLWRARRGHTFQIHERDQAGAQALAELRDRGLNEVANTLAQSAEHLIGFFSTLRAELAFYLGCVNLHERLAAQGSPLTFPAAAAPGSRRHRCTGLYDVCLALATGRPVVGNDLDADARDAIIITGANQGGKSTFLRALGVAQLMMQCGMFVPARSFCADLRGALLSHFPREEDAAPEGGRLDEELRRASEMVDALTPGALVLLNESFATTNEREGSEIARQVLDALTEAGVKVLFVTHLHEFAARLHAERRDNVLFLRAERGADGHRTFRLTPGEPLATSFGADLYAEVFGGRAEPGGGE